jgi:hypothetical protein
MKSGGQIVGQMSSQSPVVWWYREVNCEVVEMCVGAVRRRSSGNEVMRLGGGWRLLSFGALILACRAFGCW